MGPTWGRYLSRTTILTCILLFVAGVFVGVVTYLQRSDVACSRLERRPRPRRAGVGRGGARDPGLQTPAGQEGAVPDLGGTLLAVGARPLPADDVAACRPLTRSRGTCPRCGRTGGPAPVQLPPCRPAGRRGPGSELHDQRLGRTELSRRDARALLGRCVSVLPRGALNGCGSPQAHVEDRQGTANNAVSSDPFGSGVCQRVGSWRPRLSGDARSGTAGATVPCTHRWDSGPARPTSEAPVVPHSSRERPGDVKK
jgi:hypothetical protein